MARTITSISAVISLAIPGLFPQPQTLTGWSADDIYDTDEVETTEFQMGLDSVLSAGVIPKEVVQSFTLAASSPSIPIFDTWRNTMLRNSEVLFANATVTLSSVGTKWVQSNGTLTRYPPAPNARRVLQPRRFAIVWESVIASPILPGTF